jgi:hypothetical protein
MLNDFFYKYYPKCSILFNSIANTKNTLSCYNCWASKKIIMQNIQLSIPTPCHENWHAMLPSQQGKFCSACATQVVDFSAMSDTEVLQFFTTNKNKTICGRTATDQLNRTFVANQRKSTIFKWYFKFLIVPLLILFRVNAVKAQGMVVISREAKKDIPAINKLIPSIKVKNNFLSTKQLTDTNKIEKVHIIQPSLKISGKIVDETGLPINVATISLTTNVATASDSEGAFSLTSKTIHNTITISAIGFQSKTITLTNYAPQHIILKKKIVDLKEIIIIDQITNRRIRCYTSCGSRITACSIKKNLSDSIFKFSKPLTSSIVVFPNPVKKGQQITIQGKLNNTQAVSIILFDAAGRQLLSLPFIVASKNFLQSIALNPNWASGTYTINLLQNNAKIHAAQFLIIN